MYLRLLAASALSLALIAPGFGDVVFSQDFSSSTNLADYINASANATNTTQFTEISTSGDGGVWSISNGALVMDRTATATFGQTNVLRRQNLDGLTLMSLSYKMTITNDTNSSHIYDGTGVFTGVGNIPLGGWSQRLNSFGIREGTSAGTFRVVGTNTNFSVGQTYTYTVFSNNSGASTTYLAPDGSTQTLDGDNYAVWIGTTAVINNAVNNFTLTSGQNLTAIGMNWGKPDGERWILDDFVVRNDLAIVVVPEPAAVALLALGGLLMVARKR